MVLFRLLAFRPLPLLLAAGAVVLALGCKQPRQLTLSRQHYAALAADEPVDVYVGRLEQPRKRIAVIETKSVGFVDDDIKRQWVAELQAKARGMGANALEDTRILTKKVSGFVPDPQTPFASVRQGKTEYYFMRATAVRVEPDEPGSLAAARPAKGWVVEKLPEPPKLPSLREEATPAANPVPAAEPAAKANGLAPDSKVVTD